jgi:hypothetical protein
MECDAMNRSSSGSRLSRALACPAAVTAAASVVAAAVLTLAAGPVGAQTVMPTVNVDAPAPQAKTREQVKLERDEFLRSHEWDADNDAWVLKPEFEAPEGVKSREEVKRERDRFMSTHRWDPDQDEWVSLGGESRDLDRRTREEVRAETRAFLRTHEWDADRSVWKDKRYIRSPRR